MTYDPNPVPIHFTDHEIDFNIRDIIANLNSGDTISYKNLCSQIIELARSNNKLTPDTQYSSNELSYCDQIRVCRFLWELILEKKVYTVFGNSPFLGGGSDTIFVVA